jgi:hypothetical protein
MPADRSVRVVLHREHQRAPDHAVLRAKIEQRPLCFLRHLAADWLKRAYRYAKIERPRGGLWHPFRRKFATERKFYPLRDVADGGGWKDVGTLLTCYQLSDEDTLRTVMDNPKPLRRPRAGRG